MPWSDWDEGVVHKVARLGNTVMVYGNGGRAALQPYNANMAVGFGLVDEVMGTGISKGFHMAGNQSLHGFIDTNNEFWVVGPDLGFEKLGYKEWFDDLSAENEAIAAGTPIVVSYYPNERRFYIGGYSTGYVLTEWGLYTATQSATSVGNYRGNVLCGFFKDLGDDEARFKLVESDLGQRGMKTLDHVEMGIDTAEDAYVGVDTRYNKTPTYTTRGWKRVNKEGVGYIGKTSPDFRLKVKIDDYTTGTPKVDSLKVRWKMVDKRSIRGMYNAGAGR
jgi:hypothetical protein